MRKGITAEVRGDLFRQVKEGTGCVVIDRFDRSDIFNPEFLMLQPTTTPGDGRLSSGHRQSG